MDQDIFKSLNHFQAQVLNMSLSKLFVCDKLPTDGYW